MANQDSQISTIDDDQDDVVVAPAAVRIVANETDSQASGLRSWVTLHAAEGEAGQQAQYIASNNINALVPRGIRVSLPDELVETLRNATHTLYETIGGKAVSREVRRFNFDVHGPDTESNAKVEAKAAIAADKPAKAKK